MTDFAARLIAWQQRNGRRSLPWQGTRDPYRIWISEIMLQQTQVATVIPYFERFVARFPDIPSLARAAVDEIMAQWSGLGYYARARNLHRAAKLIASQYDDVFPRDFDSVARLPGIGRSTASAICAFAFGERRPILDGNVKRVFARYFGIDEYPGKKNVETVLWKRAEQLLPERDIEIYAQALMDLGATVCTRARPSCVRCPLRSDCAAFNGNRVDELPRPRPRRALRRKSVQWLILLRGGEVLLEKRPPTGIWGGLWCLPEIPEQEPAPEWCSTHYAVMTEQVLPLPRFQHVFSHFALEVVPQLVRVRAIATRAQQPGTLWLDLHEASDAAAPSPVKRLLGWLAARSGGGAVHNAL
jgi:A/G-specific adenine glycosylase